MLKCRNVVVICQIGIRPDLPDKGVGVGTWHELLDRRWRTFVMLVVVSEGGPAESAAAITKGTADLAVVRGDLGIPASGQVVAILRHFVVALIVPAAGARAPKDAKKAKVPKIEKIEQLAGRRIG